MSGTWSFALFEVAWNYVVQVKTSLQVLALRNLDADQPVCYLSLCSTSGGLLA
jgi:hypothetical protein